MKTSKVLAECMYEKTQVRVLGTKSEPWFVAVDVFKALGLSLKNMSRTLKNLDDDEKFVIDLSKNSTASPFKLKGEKTEIAQGSHNTVWIISEPGLYKIMLSSRTEKARKFTRWVTHEVLPNIRRHGYYKLSIQEQKVEAYKSIMELANLTSLDKRFEKMSLSALESYERELKYKHQIEEETRVAKEEYPYLYDEMDKLCYNDIEFVKYNYGIYGNDKPEYMITLRNGDELFSKKFKKDIPKFKKELWGK